MNEDQKFSQYPEDQRSKSKYGIKYNKFLRSDEGWAGLDLTQTVVGLYCKLQHAGISFVFTLGCYHLSRAGSGRTRSVGSSLTFQRRGRKEGPLICTAKQGQSFYHHLPCSFVRWLLKKTTQLGKIKKKKKMTASSLPPLQHYKAALIKG